MYRLLFDLVLRRLDPERAHHLAFGLIRAVASVPGVARTAGRRARVAPVEVPHLGVVPGRFGLAAGFDKDAVGVRGLRMLGFAFLEVGTVTARPQPGNERPRLWRVLERRALRNRMGFNNEGAELVGARLRLLRAERWGGDVVLGVNIGKSKVTPVEEAAEDYAMSARLTAPYADYLVVNVSSPNTPGLRDLQSVEALRPVLRAVREAADAATPRGRTVPLLVKIAPDLGDEDVDAVADLVRELDLEGVVAVNTTIDHDLGPGGLSGPPVRERGLAVVRRLRERLGEERLLIGVGGVTTVDDARAYRAAGADLVQGYTGFVYEGPAWPARMTLGLARSEQR